MSLKSSDHFNYSMPGRENFKYSVKSIRVPLEYFLNNCKALALLTNFANKVTRNFATVRFYLKLFISFPSN